MEGEEERKMDRSISGENAYLIVEEMRKNLCGLMQRQEEEEDRKVDPSQGSLRSPPPAPPERQNVISPPSSRRDAMRQPVAEDPPPPPFRKSMHVDQTQARMGHRRSLSQNGNLDALGKLTLSREDDELPAEPSPPVEKEERGRPTLSKSMIAGRKERKQEKMNVRNVERRTARWFWQADGDINPPLGVLHQQGRKMQEEIMDTADIGIVDESLARLVESHESCPPSACAVHPKAPWPEEDDALCHSRVYRLRAERGAPVPRYIASSRSTSPPLTGLHHVHSTPELKHGGFTYGSSGQARGAGHVPSYVQTSPSTVGYVKSVPGSGAFTFMEGLGVGSEPLSYLFVVHPLPTARGPFRPFSLQSLATRKFPLSKSGVRNIGSAGRPNSSALLQLSRGLLVISTGTRNVRYAAVRPRTRTGHLSMSATPLGDGSLALHAQDDRVVEDMHEANADAEGRVTRFYLEEVQLSELRQIVLRDLSNMRLAPVGLQASAGMRRTCVRSGRSWDPPLVSWRRRLSDTFPDHEEFDVTARDAMRLAGLGYRMYRYIQRERHAGRIPIMNPFYKSPAGPRMGVPIGGIGSGTIGRGWLGSFGRWQLYPGFPNYETVDANAFAVHVGPRAGKRGSLPKATVLSAVAPKSKVLERAWDWKLHGRRSSYYARYPLAWTVYNEPDDHVRLTCKQLSPVIAHNYKESSYPVGTFEWHIENLDAENERVVSLMFSFQNGIGEEAADTAGGHTNRLFVAPMGSGPNVVGIAMSKAGKAYRRGDYLWKPGMDPVVDDDMGSSTDSDLDTDINWEEVMKSGLDPKIEEALAASASKLLDKPLQKADPLTLGIAVQPDDDRSCDIFWCQKYITNNLDSASRLWHSFKADGSVADTDDSGPARPGETIGSCLAVRFRVPPGGVRSLVFALAWDMPICRFSCGRAYYRRYTKWFGRDGNAIEALLKEAIMHHGLWDRQISAWQDPIVANPNLPIWYRHALFNELYYLIEGGSIWTHGMVEEDEGEDRWVPDNQPEVRAVASQSLNSVSQGLELPYVRKERLNNSAIFGETSPGSSAGKRGQPPLKKQGRHSSVHSVTCQTCRQVVRVSQLLSHHCVGHGPGGNGIGKQAPYFHRPRPGEEQPWGVDDDDDMGRFGYMESLEYLMVNTYDVHFYASWALAMNWPRLEAALQRDFATFSLVGYNYQWRTLHSGKKALRKVEGAVPHDLGTPGEDPWFLVNSYNIQPINDWKDLNSKFVLQVYRGFVVSGDRELLWSCWDSVRKALAYVAKFDYDMDGVIENEGFPDQTYDTWSAVGCSAYSGGLWLAALAAGAAISRVLGNSQFAQRYEQTLLKGRRSYFCKLWNDQGGYFNYDNSRNPRYDSVMADQMCGQWYSRACGLPPIVPEKNARSALRMVYEYNVLAFRDGELGAVNGMRPDKTVDTGSLQSVEVWTGTTFGLSAAMLGEGLVDEAFDTAWGIVNTTYEVKGYHFQTPEAWNSQAQYRALSYMRPLAIWGIQWAWDQLGDKINDRLQ